MRVRSKFTSVAPSVNPAGRQKTPVVVEPAASEGPALLSASEAAAALTEELGQPVKPRWIVVLGYERELRPDRCPIVGGRRLISRAYLPEVARALRNRGWIPSGQGVADA